MSAKCRGCESKDAEIAYLRERVEVLTQALSSSSEESRWSALQVHEREDRDGKLAEVEEGNAIPVESVMSALREVHFSDSCSIDSEGYWAEHRRQFPELYPVREDESAEADV